MTAEAIARLRDRLTVADPALVVMVVRLDDLRALLDAHAALEAARREVTDLTGDLTPEVLTRLSDVQGYVRCGDRAALSVDYARGVADERARVGFDRWPVLIPFVAAMVRKLDANKAKKGGRDGWMNDDPMRLLARVREEVDELERAVLGSGPSGTLDEAADVANMAMMVADASGLLADERGEHESEGA